MVVIVSGAVRRYVPVGTSITPPDESASMQDWIAAVSSVK